jgi:FAD/FMN-containing dehydrogenase/Fe-S oxidoreductase
LITLLNGAAAVDVAALERALRAELRGDVRFEAGYRSMYSTDASNYRQVPIGVVAPRDAEDVVRAFAVCRRFGAPVLARGAGTGLAGQTCNVAVVFDYSKYMNAIVDIDWESKIARVQPGCVTDDLKAKTQPRNLIFGPDPATHDRNTFGGMIGNNSCGMHAQMAGKCAQNVEELEILTYDGLRLRVGATKEEELDRIIAEGGRRGDIYRRLRDLRNTYAERIRRWFPDIPRRISGYGLDWLLPENGFNVARALVGTEGTCVAVLEASVNLVYSPPFRALTVLGFADLATAADNVPHCNAHSPLALEGIDESLFEYMQAKGIPMEDRELFPNGRAWLVVEFGGATADEAELKARALVSQFDASRLEHAARTFTREDDQRRLWRMRDNALGATSKIPNKPDFYPGWEDSAVAPDRLGSYLRGLQSLMNEYGYTASLYGHFGQGCVHGSIDFDLFTAEGIARYRSFVTKAARLCVAHGGSLSGEHGDGQSRGELLPIMYGDELVEAFGQFKDIWDPSGRMNPGKVVRPRKLDQDLRWGAGYEPRIPKTHFSFPNDYGSFAYAANRCVGTGKCRKHDAGTMCPSYMATREEAYSTRGRARLLFELLRGDLRDGWRDESVKDALEFCLACKACKSECPVNVDMATYKAEFLSHYYARRPRPVHAYAFGLMMFWARLASFMPRLANAVSHAPLLGTLLKGAIGMARYREPPLFANESFYAWFARRVPRKGTGTAVILWPDTWNAYFHPETLRAAVEILEDAGFRVTLPRGVLCCGRPLYDYGMLGLARRMLLDCLRALREDVRKGTYVVGLEPSCVSVFRDELTNLLAHDEDARRLSQRVLLFEEFLAKCAPEYRTPKLQRHAVVHQHCHHKSVLDEGAQKKMFDAVSLDYEFPDTGCCGMAGAFGFEREHYDVSMKCGERVLLPRVREASKQTLVVADGFSCREQIAQSTERQAMHPVEVVHMAMCDDGAHRNDAFPERRYRGDFAIRRRRAVRDGAALFAGAVLGVAIAGALYASRR